MSTFEETFAMIRSRVADAATAEEFARRILAAAKPVERRAYLRELDMIRWPGADHVDQTPNRMGPCIPG